ncbi:hypothetical protein GCM10018963_20240 [Saccharothrix longispora]
MEGPQPNRPSDGRRSEGRTNEVGSAVWVIAKPPVTGRGSAGTTGAVAGGLSVAAAWPSGDGRVSPVTLLHPNPATASRKPNPRES